MLYPVDITTDTDSLLQGTYSFPTNDEVNKLSRIYKEQGKEEQGAIGYL